MTSKIRKMVVAAGLLLAAASLVPAAHADDTKATVRAGYLTCHVSSGWGFIFGSSRSMKCSYAMQSNYTEYYTGSITKFGADIGYLSSAVMIWAVVAPTNNLGQGALAGHYAGATASAAIGVGAGAQCSGRRVQEFDRAAADHDRRPERPERGSWRGGDGSALRQGQACRRFIKKPL